MFSEVSFISPLKGVGCSDAEREEEGLEEEREEDDTDFSEDPGDRYIAEQLGIVLNAEGGDPLARMAGLTPAPRRSKSAWTGLRGTRSSHSLPHAPLSSSLRLSTRRRRA